MGKEPASLFLYDINYKTQKLKCGDKMKENEGTVNSWH